MDVEAAERRETPRSAAEAAAGPVESDAADAAEAADAQAKGEQRTTSSAAARDEAELEFYETSRAFDNIGHWDGCMCEDEHAAIHEATEQAKAKGLTPGERTKTETATHSPGGQE